ncbi:SusC/RagA family TonB-linked outer membrane protein [Chryseosolibacter indicus]|uniref:TonB-dependent receptor n=1 Tax=Chryseosolibacter indicus TaxID=2782351 RepID=A0ABS5VX30_9BACT|nr:TonB-dependent receptor [Chryseosolibacter indicus]MBT1705623.1 TonB-dependent receptor [Chryseosolibacter indicus]
MQNKYKQLLKTLMMYSLIGVIIQCVVLASAFASGAIQQQDITVTGTVRDADDQSGNLPGVNVLVKGTTRGTTTDADGRYTIQVDDPNATLVFSFIGYSTQEVAVAARSVVDVVLAPDIQQLGEVVVVGYGTQEKVTLTGAVSNIRTEELLRTKNENPQNMLTGKIAGVRVWQKSAEPGTFNNNFDIRGFEGTPLVVIDGIPRTMADFQRLNPSDIDDVSVLKDASASIYGVRGASGVMLVTTKKGTRGKPTITYNGSYTLQQPVGFPRLADPYQTMTLYNEKAMNKVEGGSIIYGPDKFEEFRSGARPTTDWNSLLISDFSPQTQHDISISGGTDKTQYYIAGGYLFQEGIFKSGDLNYNKFNLRSNITTEIAKGLKLNLNLSGFADTRNTPYAGATDIIRNYWRQGVLFPAYADADNTMLSYEGLDLEENTVAKMRSDISGYRKYQQKNFQSSASLDFDFGTVLPELEGLSAKALISFDYRNDDNKIYRREYYQYALDPLTNTYTAKLYNNSSPNQMRRELYSKQQVLGQFLLNYNRTFGNDHKVTGLLGVESQKRTGDNFYAQRDLAFAMEYLLGGVDENQVSGMSGNMNDLYAINYNAVLGRLNYTFADRYIVEGQFRYDGSSKFIEDDQWGFFPSGSIGWRLSEESFFKSSSTLSFVDQLKLRASYGVLANDEGMAYDWATGYTYPAVGNNAEKGYYNEYAPGYMFGGKFVYGVDNIVSNKQLTWWTAKMFDVGVDFEAWNGLFGFSVDYFDRRREGLFESRKSEIPTVVGTKAPKENVNSDRQFGIDMTLSHRNTLGQLAYGVKVIGTVTRRQWLTAVQNGPYGNSYDRWRHDNLNDRYQGIQFGYEKAGRYENWEDIWSYPIYKDRVVLPGDYKYEDWNGDGEINAEDEHPFAFDQTPWVNFSLAYNASYKNFDLNFLFQGTALGSMQYKEPLYSIWGSNGGGTLEQYLDRWHPVDPLADPYNVETEWVSGYYGYTGSYPRDNSQFNRVSTAYLRLKSIEFGYTLPKKIRAFSSMDVRVFANAYNIFTITGVKFVDPEHPEDDNGRLYPLNKTYTVGVSARF